MTDKELDALVRLAGYHREHVLTGDLVLINPDGPAFADAITTLRTQLAEVQAERDAWRDQCRDPLLGSFAKALADHRESIPVAIWNHIDALQKQIDYSANGKFGPVYSGPMVDAAFARAERAEAEVRSLKAAIFGSENYAHDLKCGNFVEMAQTLHAAQKGGLDRAERAEAALAEIKQTLGAPDDWHPVYAVKALKQSNDLADAALAAQIEADAGIAGYYASQDYCAMGYPEDGGIAASGTAETIRHEIRSQPHDRTALDRMLAEAREQALREVADVTAYMPGSGTHKPIMKPWRDAILALIEAPDGSRSLEVEG